MAAKVTLCLTKLDVTLQSGIIKQFNVTIQFNVFTGGFAELVLDVWCKYLQINVQLMCTFTHILIHYDDAISKST